ncbi:guanylate cyclase 2D isoform X2 [Amyelois transitella]|uniref:guanylate cyclase 2D isoform X2 n=1 Tax=Amyelois transitella TaxID=680683 RepID=UPI002990366F|nr:guanylate cyclase 2D isoform X2 [Amyelois transitella]
MSPLALALPVAALLAALPAAPAPAPPALVVLRAACEGGDRTLFEEQRLSLYMADTRRGTPYLPIRILGYNETCGPDWKVEVTRNALLTISSGGTVSFAGWAGAGACEALSAATRALRRPLPTACAAPAARAAGVAELARRLRWRRALLPPAAPHSECAAALRHVERALVIHGMTVRRAPINKKEMDHHPHVVILCASVESAGLSSVALDALRGPAAPLVLLLHVERDPPPSSTDDTKFSDDAFRLSNITLDLGTSPYDKNNTSPSLVTSAPENVNLSSFYQRSNKKSLSTPRDSEVNNETPRNKRTRYGSTAPPYTPPSSLVNTIKTDIIVEKSQNNIVPEYIEEAAKQTFEKNKSKDESQFIASEGRVRRSAIELEYFRFVSQFAGAPQRLRLLLFTHKQLEGVAEPLIVDSVYKEVLDALFQDTESDEKRNKSNRIVFYLYETIEISSFAKWKRIAAVVATSTKSVDDSAEWNTEIELNSTTELERWSELFGNEYEQMSIGITVPTLVACVVSALAAAALLAGGARCAAVRRRRRRRRGDAVLAPQDFTFPADERRRVGEGMETMLSCWLQQLHEFGGPELERPDLLKQPPLPAPHAPSVPSSTCSINRVTVDRRTRYKGDAVHMKYLPTASLELKRKATDVLLVMQNLRHENLNPFIGCLCEVRPALVFDYCGRGSLEDVLMADDIKLDWTFRLSLLTDLVKGMRYLHASPLRLHGRLSSRSCAVDSRWVLRVTDHGASAFFRAQALPEPERSPRDLLWTAPEILRETRHGTGGARGSQAGDVFSFAIIMQEVIVRGEPYCMLSLTPAELLEKLRRPPPLIRPSVSMGAAPPEAVSVMRQCWSEAPDLRPDFSRLHDIFRHLHRGKKINIVDSMFEMLEKYSNNLEELIRERTEQLDMEKKKTEQLLNRMLPRSVAERLMLGSRVEPEEFEEVSIYFSDIVGFTALAARSTPVQVVDLLNDLYTTFDAAIEQYSVYKVETIGDAYMVVGGLPVRTANHAESIATMALHLLHLAGRFRVRHLPGVPLRLRIGLHTGACCAGVVGLTMPRYCLFGDTVNTASRMESTGAAWRIQVSAATAERLTAAGGYRLRSRGLTQIKGKGAMHTFWLLGKEGFDKPLPTPPPLESEEVLFETDGENDSSASSAPAASPARAPAVERQCSDPPAAVTDKYDAYRAEQV